MGVGSSSGFFSCIHISCCIFICASVPFPSLVLRPLPSTLLSPRSLVSLPGLCSYNSRRTGSRRFMLCSGLPIGPAASDQGGFVGGRRLEMSRLVFLASVLFDVLPILVLTASESLPTGTR